MIAATPASSKRRARSSARQLRLLGPALDRDLAVARVEADRDAARDTACAASFTSAGSRTAAVPMMTRSTPFSSQPSIVVMSRMPPPSCTRQADGLEDALDRRAVHRLAGERAVEIDHVQPWRKPCVCERVRLRGRVVVEHGRARHVALLQAHAAPSLRSMAGNRIMAAVIPGERSESRNP